MALNGQVWMESNTKGKEMEKYNEIRKCMVSKIGPPLYILPFYCVLFTPLLIATPL